MSTTAYDPRHGYHGPYPVKGEQAFNHFHANEAQDGHAMQVMLVMTAATNMPRDFLAEATPVAAGSSRWRRGPSLGSAQIRLKGPLKTAGPFSASRANVARSQAAM